MVEDVELGLRAWSTRILQDVMACQSSSSKTQAVLTGTFSPTSTMQCMTVIASLPDSARGDTP